jgi:hypothetical protein
MDDELNQYAGKVGRDMMYDIDRMGCKGRRKNERWTYLFGSTNAPNRLISCDWGSQRRE